MAELQLTIPYKTLPARIVFSGMCALFPLWAVVAPAALGFFIGCTLSNPAALPPWATITGCIGLLLFTIFSVVITALAEDNRIHVSKDGLAFPLFMLPRLGFRRNRSWVELQGADVLSGTGKPPYLVLNFGGALLPLKTNCMSTTDVEQLCLSVELWATNCQRTAQLVDYQKQIQNEGRALGQTGYTQMWEEELARRFSATAFMPLEPGQELQGGRLKITRQLAFGGLSAIYLAQENKRDLVVIKEAVVPAGSDEQARAQAEQHLVREAEMLAQLDHPRVAKVLDHFVDQGRHYLKLEYINGQDLRQFVKQNGPLTEARAIEWGMQIAAILDYLHRRQPPIIHRDLTPDNLVLGPHGDVMLIDFGAANVFVGTATGTIVGKQAYIPAEQLRGKAVLASDIYALGGTLYYLLTGKDPLPLAVSRPKAAAAEISDELDELVARCLEFEPDDRFQTAADVMSALKLLAARQKSPQEVTIE
jgi:predicted Ser/Thr protein kinase